MSLIRTMDALLRNPDSVYARANDPLDARRLCASLIVIFIVTSALYGAVMGGFRWLHPDFMFSDFELASESGHLSATGSVAGVDFSRAMVYTDAPPPRSFTPTQIRFNLTQPTEAYRVIGVTEEKGFTAIALDPASPLSESSAWTLPLLVALKTPALFLLTLGVCSMALYVLNLALDVRLHFAPVMTTMLFGLAATGVMLAVFIPIAALFSVVTADYHFMKVFHTMSFAIAGMYGVRILYRGLVHLAPEGARNVRGLVFLCLILYCLVGGQVAWTLKPYLGTPYLPATPPFRVEAGNIYVSMFSSASHVARPRSRMAATPDGASPERARSAEAVRGGTSGASRQ